MTEKERLTLRLKELSHLPKRSLGQNFLISDNVIDKIVNSALDGSGHILEIGPGLGALTEKIVSASSIKSYHALELDHGLAEYWQQRGLKVSEGDALKLEWEKLEIPSNAVLVSNLPYQISSSLVIERSVVSFGISKMVLMFQKEVAERITAKPASKEYGLLSVLAQTQWQIKKICDARPSDFFPAPKVASRVLEFVSKEHRYDPQTMDGFLKFVKAAYAQRRKLLIKNIKAVTTKKDQELEEIFKSRGFLRTARAEELTPEQIFDLYRGLRGVS